MVTKESKPGSTPLVSASSIPLRRLVSVFLMILLYTAATPFTPFYWVLSMEGMYLFDRALAGFILLSSLYFQWQISSCTGPVTIVIPMSAIGSDTTIRSGGRVGASKSSEDIIWFYRPSEYWKYVSAAVVMLSIAEWGGYEYVRRLLVTIVIAGSWGIGWFCTPVWVKKQAWEVMKGIWFWLAVDEVMNIGRGGGGHRRRGRRF